MQPTGHGIQFLPQYSFMPQTKKLRISQKHLSAIFMQNWQLEVIFDSWLKNRYIIWQAWNYISMQLWFRPVLIGIDPFCSLRELQTNDCECWYARWVLHRDYRYMQNPLNFGAETVSHDLYDTSVQLPIHVFTICLLGMIYFGTYQVIAKIT